MQLHFQSYGQGTPLIILHGLFGSLDNWHTMARHLAARFRVLSVDLRNHGQSAHDPEMNYPVMAADVAELMRNQGLAQAHLLGHSMGGKVAMELALEHPDCVSRLIVVDIAPKAYPPHHEDILQAMRSLDLKSFQERGPMEAELVKTIPEKAVRQFILKSVGREVGGAFHWKLNLDALLAARERLAEAIAPGRVFNQPTLFLCGGRSTYVLEGDLGGIRSLFPQAQLQRIAGAGHWVHAEAPQAFLQAAEEFLQE